jgi:hypothetical protein
LEKVGEGKHKFFLLFSFKELGRKFRLKICNFVVDCKREKLSSASKFLGRLGNPLLSISYFNFTFSNLDLFYIIFLDFKRALSKA